MRQRFDGLQVEVTRGRFSGTFDIDVGDADYLGMASAGAMLVVVVRPAGVSIEEMGTGLRRVDKLVVKNAAVVRSDVVRKQLAEMFELELPAEVVPVSTTGVGQHGDGAEVAEVYNFRAAQ